MNFKILILVLAVLLSFGCAQMTGNVSTTVHVERTESDGTATIIDYESYGDKQSISGLSVTNLLGADVKVDSREQEGSFDSKLLELLLQQTEQMRRLYMQPMQ